MAEEPNTPSKKKTMRAFAQPKMKAWISRLASSRHNNTAALGVTRVDGDDAQISDWGADLRRGPPP